MRASSSAAVLIAVTALAFLLSACSDSPGSKVCSDPLGCVELAPGEPLRLGVIESLSGEVAPIGKDQVRGLELALARRDGKVLDREVRLFIEDTGCRPEGGGNAALKLVADPKIAAIFGTTCSSDAATAAEVMSRAGFTMISGNNSAPFLTAIGGKMAPKRQAGYFRTAPNEESSGPAAAMFAYTKLGVRKAAVINDGDIYTRGLTDGFTQMFQKLGGQVVLTATVNKSDTNMGPVLTAVRNSRAELMFFPLFQPEGNHMLTQARKTRGLEKVVLMSDGSLIEQSFIEAVKDAARGMYFVGPTPPAHTPELARLEADYKAKYGVAPSTYYYVNAFDAAEILFAALEQAASRGKDGSLRIGRQALRDALARTDRPDGMSGALRCDEFGDCAAQSFNILRLGDPAAGVEGLKQNVQFTYKPDR